MAFNLYFAGWGSKDADQYLRDKNALRLLSYYNEHGLIGQWWRAGLSERLFIDSGAFTVAHSGAQINIDKYIKFINEHPEIKIWAELDVIPYPVLNKETAIACSEASWENFNYMRERVTSDCKILPLYHYGEPESALERILNTKIDGKYVEYIGMGGRHGVKTPEQIEYFKRIWSIIKSSDNPNVKVHAFGVTVPSILTRFPFYSADSSTWVQAAINGAIVRKDLTLVTISDGQTHSPKHFKKMAEEAGDVIRKEVEAYGYTLEDLCAHYRKRLRYNIDVMYDWAQEYQLKERSEEFVGLLF